MSGTGFAGNSNITFALDGETINVGVTETSANGSFTNNTFTIPPCECGSHTIQAKDARGNSADAVFTVEPKIIISPTSGTAGTTVTVNGTGFRARKSVTIKYGTGVVTTDSEAITSDATGGFTATFKVPAGLTGTFAVEASDGTYRATSSFVAIFEIIISPTTSEAEPGHVGMELTISGTGLQPNARVTITRTTDSIVLACTDTDAVGAFSVTFAVPPGKCGTHVITITDGTSGKQFSFVMESQVPPVPTLLLPEKDVKAKQPVYLDWKDVNDASGVTYTLQIASSDDFTSILFYSAGKGGLDPVWVPHGQRGEAKISQ